MEEKTNFDIVMDKLNAIDSRVQKVEIWIDKIEKEDAEFKVKAEKKTTLF
jgi:hypothetical protein